MRDYTQFALNPTDRLVHKGKEFRVICVRIYFMTTTYVIQSRHNELNVRGVKARLAITETPGGQFELQEILNGEELTQDECDFLEGTYTRK